eukprot:GEMP01001458.1.p1 GENE.GEMP01001458.1~~GEMP01001458.1.p1  ORF type:complete len:1587 (+),score=294.07 GEMP01001458.1:153-4913(+)
MGFVLTGGYVPVSLPLDAGYTLALCVEEPGNFVILSGPWRVEMVGRAVKVEGVEVCQADESGLVVLEIWNDLNQLVCTPHVGTCTAVPWQSQEYKYAHSYRTLCGQGRVQYLWIGPRKDLSKMLSFIRKPVNESSFNEAGRPYKVIAPLIGAISHPHRTPFFVADAFDAMDDTDPESVAQCFKEAVNTVLPDFAAVARRLNALDPGVLTPDLVRCLPLGKHAFYHLFTHDIWRQADVEVRHARSRHFYTADVPPEDIFCELMEESDEGCVRWLVSGMLDSTGCTDEFLTTAIQNFSICGSDALCRALLRAMRLRNPRSVAIQQFLFRRDPLISSLTVICLHHFNVEPTVELLRPLCGTEFPLSEADSLSAFLFSWLAPTDPRPEELTVSAIVGLLTTMLHVVEYTTEPSGFVLKIRQWVENSRFALVPSNSSRVADGIFPKCIIEAVLCAMRSLPDDEGLVLLFASIIGVPICSSEYSGYDECEYAIAFGEDSLERNHECVAKAMGAVLFALSTRFHTSLHLGSGTRELIPLSFLLDDFFVAPRLPQNEDFIWPSSGAFEASVMLTAGNQEVIDALLGLWNTMLIDPTDGLHPMDMDMSSRRNHMKEQSQILLTQDARSSSNVVLVERLVALSEYCTSDARVRSFLRTACLTLLTTGLTKNTDVIKRTILAALGILRRPPHDDAPEALEVIGEIICFLKVLQRDKTCTETECSHPYCELLRELGQEHRLTFLPLASIIASWFSFGAKEPTPREFAGSVEISDKFNLVAERCAAILTMDNVTAQQRLRTASRERYLLNMEGAARKAHAFGDGAQKKEDFTKQSRRARRKARKLERATLRPPSRWFVDQMEDLCGRRTLISNVYEGGSSSSSSNGEEDDETFPCFLVRREGRLPANLIIHKSGISLKTEGKCRKYKFEDLRGLFPRRYLLRPSALELHFEAASAPILLHFEGPTSIKPESSFEELFRKSWLGRPFGPHTLSNRDKVWVALDWSIKAFSSTAPLATVNKSDPATLRQIHEENGTKDLMTYTEQWRNGEISNFFYLNALNFHSGRSAEDLSQYPIFPWVLGGSRDHMVARDLAKTMGNLGSPRRRQQYAERFKELQNENGRCNVKDESNGLLVPPYHYGSHYSSPAIVISFLVRVEPFAEEAKKLQGGKFDLPDRIFASIEETWRSSTSIMSDVRELLPEFYCLPEAFLNWNNFDFGTRQCGSSVPSDVEFPEWVPRSDAPTTYHFVHLMRKTLESDETTRELHNWIDLVWGHKQTGPESIKSLNCFFHLTYEGNTKGDTASMNEMQQLLGFGQTPKMLFSEPHVEALCPTCPSFFSDFSLTESRRVPGKRTGWGPHLVVHASANYIVTLELSPLRHSVPTNGSFDAETRVLLTGGYLDESFVISTVGRRDAGSIVTATAIYRLLLLVGLNNGAIRFYSRSKQDVDHVRSYPAVKGTTGSVLSIVFDTSKPMVAAAQSKYIRLFRTTRKCSHLRDLEAPDVVLQVKFGSRSPASVVGLLEDRVIVWSINGPQLACIRTSGLCIASISERDKQEGLFVATENHITFYGLPFLDLVREIPFAGRPMSFHVHKGEVFFSRVRA